MEQLVLVIFIIGMIFLAEKTGSPIYNLIGAGFSFYLAFSVGVSALMILLIFVGLYQLLAIYTKFRN